MGLLSFILLLPLIGAAAVLLLPSAQKELIRRVALGAAGLSLLGALYLAFGFDTAAGGMQYTENLAWVPEMGMTYALGVDGIALVMVLLTTIITFCCLMATKADIKSPKGFFTWFLLLETAVIGVFCAMDWFLFFMFWEFTLIPMFFLIGVWGGARRDSASLSFFLYTLTGSVAMLLGIVAVYATVADHNFSMAVLAEAGAGLSTEMQIVIFLGFLIGLGVKMPIVPMHGWLPLAHVEAPVPASMFLSAVMLKMGAYGLFRAGVMLPEGLAWFVPILFALGVISLIYGALQALRQTDLKAMVAYSSVSHMGFVLIGLAGAGIAGFTGAVMQMVAHGFVSAALFFLVGVLYERTGTRDIRALSGIGRQVPKLALATSLTLLAAMGLPGFAGFVAEFHVIVGAFEGFGLAVLLISAGVLLTAAYSLRVIAKLFTGRPDPRHGAIGDLNASETATAVPLVGLLLLLGIIPGLALIYVSPTIAEIVTMIGR
ncbi:NADH-ubiquinone oxidoreductase chain M [Candidatus Rhodobacter oscarellae]|uniref:NADH-ubiquinone oxidoreductase chain M n=1 Tax=Candidatus Rhodobacter oscarellae TaxID=1675527 RepID=A0A0J9EAX6_9RHOB|nr:NADH-quinone oxidoreductase subunit M [Candidatus Rhodobacter lobularis]KMW59932.1 NADH-ubiquinone oxidoreductase chain M [Candidatus Rhodobacter lobularis]